MNDLNNMGFGISSGPTPAPGTGSAALFERLARDPTALRTSGSRQTTINRLPTGSVPSTNAAPAAKLSAEQVKAFAQNYVKQCWANYAKLYPEAFAVGGRLGKSPPQLVFLPTQAEVNRVYGVGNNLKNIVAFVRAEGSRIYIHTPNLIKYVNQFGPNYVKTTMSHELIHTLTNPFSVRVFNDVSGRTESYAGVRNELASSFYFDQSKNPGMNDSFSVNMLIAEFAAEYFASKATGLPSFSVAYAPLRQTGQELLRIVGESVFRKAVLGNDPVAYRKVVKAAMTLQEQNARVQLLGEKNEAVTDVRAAQAAAPFGTPLTAGTLEKIDHRYYREYALHNILEKYFPDQIKQFDFRFLNEVNAHLRRQRAPGDQAIGDEDERAMNAAFRAVWPLLK